MNPIGRMASRFLAILIAVHALAILPSLISSLAGRGVSVVVAPLIGGLAAEVVLLAALALHCWYRADSVGALLLPPRGRAPAGLEATAFRAVGLYVVVIALAAVANWVVVLATRGAVPTAVAPLLVPALLELALGLIVIGQAPALSRILGGRRR